ncbi:MAG: CARDB domain-containing protein [Psychroserpens sp.]|uniref:CARDB domain-containing protein n=1 Tax=Psychroserpens sp. TaxID=2020870 RepID=UPI00300349F8
MKQTIIIMTTIILFSCGQKKEDRNGKITPEVPPVVEVPQEIVSAKLPDLMIISSSVSPKGMVAPKTKCKFAVKVKNIGRGDYNHAISVGGPGIVGRGFNSLKAGETKEVVVEYTPVSKNATYTLKFKVDPDNVIKETNESNNESQTYTIKTTF